MIAGQLYTELAEALSVCGKVEVAQLRHYIAYRRMVNVASVLFRPKHEAILVYPKVDPVTVELEDGFSRSMRDIGHLRTLDVRIASAADLEKAGPLIGRRSRQPAGRGRAAGASGSRCSGRPLASAVRRVCRRRSHAHSSGPARTKSSWVSSARSLRSATSA